METGNSLYKLGLERSGLRLGEGIRAIARRFHVYRMALNIKIFLSSLDSLNLWRTFDKISCRVVSDEFGLTTHNSSYLEFGLIVDKGLQKDLDILDLLHLIMLSANV